MGGGQPSPGRAPGAPALTGCLPAGWRCPGHPGAGPREGFQPQSEARAGHGTAGRSLESWRLCRQAGCRCLTSRRSCEVCWRSPPAPSLPDARVLLLPERDLQQQQLPLQPRLCVPEGGGLHRLPQRLLPAGRQGERAGGQHPARARGAPAPEVARGTGDRGGAGPQSPPVASPVRARVATPGVPNSRAAGSFLSVVARHPRPHTGLRGLWGPPDGPPWHPKRAAPHLPRGLLSPCPQYL